MKMTRHFAYMHLSQARAGGFPVQAIQASFSFQNPACVNRVYKLRFVRQRDKMFMVPTKQAECTVISPSISNPKRLYPAKWPEHFKSEGVESVQSADSRDSPCDSLLTAW